MVFGVSVTRGPPLETSLSLDITPMPLNPVFEEPTESVMTTFGRASRYWSFTAGENSAALLEMATTEEASQSPRVNSSISGRAIASPISTTT